jgi:nucleotide-binding universal stress UspA family protein
MTPETTSLLTIYSDAESASREQHHALVDEVVAACRAAGLHAEGTVREGIAADEILTEARDWGPDLVILGCRPKRGLERLVIGSVARDVLHHAACSVLVAREAGTA